MSGRFLRPNPYGVSGKGFFPARVIPTTIQTINWTPRTSPFLGSSFLAIAVGKDNVAIALLNDIGGTIARSTDEGIHWTSQFNIALPGVGAAGIDTDGAGVWMVGTGTDGVTAGRVYVSIDNGLTWSQGGSPFGTAFGVTGVATNRAGLWVVTGTAIAATTANYAVSIDNGTTWTQPQLFSSLGWDNDSLVWDAGGSQFISLAIADAPGNPPALNTSVNGATWASTLLLSGDPLRNRPIGFGNGVYMLGQQSTPAVKIAASPAALAGAPDTLVPFLPDTADNGMYSIGFGVFNGQPTFVAMGDFGGTANSTDNGVSWIPGELNFGPPGGLNGAQAVALAGSTFIAVGDAADISTLP